MAGALLDFAPELFELVVFGLSSAGLSAIGVYVERFALSTAQSGEPTLGLWAAVMGAVALYFAFYVTADKVAPAWAAYRNAGGANE